jgi:LysM repeat protein
MYFCLIGNLCERLNASSKIVFMAYISPRCCKKLFTGLFVLMLFLSSDGYGQGRMAVADYIATYRHIAIQEMRKHGIPASIKLAQGILESGFGNSELAVNANNHFGIKCHGWPGRGYLYDDDAPRECFRLYDDPVQSWLDHSQFLLTRPRYAFLFELDPLDYESWAYGLRMAGYATNPNYPQHLIRVIEEHGLTVYDRMAMDLTAELPPLPGANNGVSHNRRTAQEDFNPVAFQGPREEIRVNRIRAVTARPGDTPGSLANELGIRTWQIVRYNELEGDRQIKPGQNIFLQPKRRRGPVSHHVARQGETMYDISQLYGIRLDQLYRRNAMEQGEQPVTGQRVLLRGRLR